MSSYPSIRNTGSWYYDTVAPDEWSGPIESGTGNIGDGLLMIYVSDYDVWTTPVGYTNVANRVTIADYDGIHVIWGTATSAAAAHFHVEQDVDANEDTTICGRIFRFNTSNAGDALVKCASSYTGKSGNNVILDGQTATEDYSLAIGGTVTRAINIVYGYSGASYYTEFFDSSNSPTQECSISLGVSGNLDTGEASLNDTVTLNTTTSLVGFSLVVGVLSGGGGSGRRVCVIG
jgi:hypothetical protein